jgi:hypothetical protein
MDAHRPILVALYLSLLRRTNRIGTERTRAGRVVFKTQFGDARLYDWLMAVGLTPKKSLTLGGLVVPQDQLRDVARGLSDGDGTIINKIYRADTRARRPYFWEYLITRFYSASRSHLDWLRSRLNAQFQVRGWIGQNGVTTAGNAMWAQLFEARLDRPARCVLLRSSRTMSGA